MITRNCNIHPHSAIPPAKCNTYCDSASLLTTASVDAKDEDEEEEEEEYCCTSGLLKLESNSTLIGYKGEVFYRFVMNAKLGPSYDFKKFFKGPITTFIHIP
jgi:hypothetical protein